VKVNADYKVVLVSKKHILKAYRGYSCDWPHSKWLSAK